MTDKHTATQMQQLKPCPFCASNPVVENGKTTYCQLDGGPIQPIIIRCKKHECYSRPSVSGGDIHNGGRQKAIEEAARRWDGRIESDKHDALVEALENMIYYARLIVDPKAHGTIKPDSAMKQLSEAEAALKAAKEGK